MKATVLKRFRDKNTMILFHQGAELELSPVRLKEINSTSAGALVEETKVVVKDARRTPRKH